MRPLASWCRRGLLPSWRASSCASRRRCCGRRPAPPRWRAEVIPHLAPCAASAATIACPVSASSRGAVEGAAACSRQRCLAAVCAHAGSTTSLIGQLGGPMIAGARALLIPQTAGLLPLKEVERGVGNWLDALAAVEAAGEPGEWVPASLWAGDGARWTWSGEESVWPEERMGMPCRGGGQGCPPEPAAASHRRQSAPRSMGCARPAPRAFPPCSL